jgi:hypothetical protein
MLGHTTYHPQTKTIACIHSICNTTPGAIATCAILVCSDALVQLPIFTDCLVAGLLGAFERCLSPGSGNDHGDLKKS